MSGFHRHNPELIGTDADPWMAVKGYRESLLPWVDPRRIEEFERRTAHICTDPDCHEIQPDNHGRCEHCGGQTVPREP